jgi:predicted small metal-binding protein
MNEDTMQYPVEVEQGHTFLLCKCGDKQVGFGCEWDAPGQNPLYLDVYMSGWKKQWDWPHKEIPMKEEEANAIVQAVKDHLDRAFGERDDCKYRIC